MTISTKLPTGLYQAHQVRELDRIAIQDLGIPGARLMERAGAVTFQAMSEKWLDARRIRVLCGGGNNGGDGFVIARYAKCAGLEVKVFLLGEPSRLVGDALGAFNAMLNAGVTPETFTTDTLDVDLHDADVVVDALFGTGLDREVSGHWAEAIAAINQAPGGTVAVDIPSGLHADNGRILGCAVQADLTVTFIGLKQGLFTGQGRDQCGDIRFDDLSVPREVYERFPTNAQRIDYDTEYPVLKPRARTAHKGDFGHVLVVGGELGFAGATRMAGEAAARAGAGLVSIATRKAHATTIGIGRPELMCHGIETVEELEPLLSRATVVAIGPGLGQSTWGRQMFDAVLATDIPMVIDADGLNLLAALSEHKTGNHPTKRSNRVLTPHPGEAARLLDCTTEAIQNDRFGSIQSLVERFGGTCILKGSGTLILNEQDALCVATDGNPGMATGGMGDALTGVIAGLMAQGIKTYHAARFAVCLHGRAADITAQRYGERGMLAGDLMRRIRRLVNGIT